MQIVIDIPERIVAHVSNGSFAMIADDVYLVAYAIFNGIPIPKGHGDLIDRNYLLDCSFKIDSRYWYCEYDEVVRVDDIKCARTILEADKEEEK